MSDEIRESPVVDPQLSEYLPYVANVDHELATAVCETASARSWTVLHSMPSAPANLQWGGASRSGVLGSSSRPW
jgi:hypothetical protein